jgi:hypothetical protein
MARLMETALKTIWKNAPGSIVECVWARVTGSTYNPATGSMVETTSTSQFSAIRGGYRTMERLAGIIAGDVKLTVDSISLPEMPEAGDVISINGVAHQVMASENFSDMAYELQMRRK